MHIAVDFGLLGYIGDSVHSQEAKGQGIYFPVSGHSNPESTVCLSVRVLPWFAIEKFAHDTVSFSSTIVVGTNPDVGT